MKILASVIIAFTLVMLLIHVSTGRILEAWDSPASSWIKRQFPPQRALRVEALYWVLALVGWSFWPSPVGNIVVVVFAAIHLGVWGAGELRVIRLSGGVALPSENHPAHRAIIAFDLVEAIVLVGIGSLTVLYLLRV